MFKMNNKVTMARFKVCSEFQVKATAMISSGVTMAPLLLTPRAFNILNLRVAWRKKKFFSLC